MEKTEDTPLLINQEAQQKPKKFGMINDSDDDQDYEAPEITEDGVNIEFTDGIFGSDLGPSKKQNGSRVHEDSQLIREDHVIENAFSYSDINANAQPEISSSFSSHAPE